MTICKMNGYSLQHVDMNAVYKITVCKMNGYNLQGMDKCSLQDGILQGIDIVMDIVCKSMEYNFWA